MLTLNKAVTTRLENPVRLFFPAICVALAMSVAALAAHAQPVPEVSGVDAKKPAVKKSEPKKPDPKKADAKKSDTKKAAAPATPAAPRAATELPPGTKIYTTGPPILRDKDGNVIPTSPDAYNVDSALPKKK